MQLFHAAVENDNNHNGLLISSGMQSEKCEVFHLNYYIQYKCKLCAHKTLVKNLISVYIHCAFSLSPGQLC